MPQVDSSVLASKVEAQLLRAARPALRRLAKASKGEANFRSEMELKACLGLARVAATLLRRPSAMSGNMSDEKLLRYLKGGL
jgi:hypothetical protein